MGYFSSGASVYSMKVIAVRDAMVSLVASRSWLEVLPKIQPFLCMYKTIGSRLLTLRGLMSKIFTLSIFAGTVIQALSILGIGILVCALSIDLWTSSNDNSKNP